MDTIKIICQNYSFRIKLSYTLNIGYAIYQNAHKAKIHKIVSIYEHEQNGICCNWDAIICYFSHLLIQRIAQPSTAQLVHLSLNILCSTRGSDSNNQIYINMYVHM